MQQRPPIWGAMFHDGSVRAKWNGNTQLFRALVEVGRLRMEYPNDNITLAFRAQPGQLWQRIGDRTQVI